MTEENHWIDDLINDQASFNQLADKYAKELTYELDVGLISTEEFFAEMKLLGEARALLAKKWKRVLRTLVPETWDGCFTDGGEA